MPKTPNLFQLAAPSHHSLNIKIMKIIIQDIGLVILLSPPQENITTRYLSPRMDESLLRAVVWMIHGVTGGTIPKIASLGRVVNPDGNTSTH